MNIGTFAVSPDAAPIVIAEAGVHHFNSVELAKQYILQTRIAGAQAIKFQTYSADRIAAKWAPTYWDAGPGGKTQHDIFASRSRISQEGYVELFAYAKELGIMMLSTPFDPDAAVLLNELGMDAYKIASADLTNWPLLQTVASFKKPMVLSTGASTFAEVRKTVDMLRGLGADIALLHCSLSYPTPIKDANLTRIALLQREFPGLHIGYSDHTEPQNSMLACPIAVSMGARIIEKHFTLNKLEDDDDHYHAVDAQGLARLVRDCKDAYLMTRPAQELTDKEAPARSFARRSIVAAKELPAGKRIEPTDVDFKRPGTGLSPTEVASVVGKTLKRALAHDELVKLEDLE
jgi:N-acetylneuraminate synthase